MLGKYCRYVGKFERGQMFRRYCVGCVHNTANLGDTELHCQYLQYRIIYPPDRKGETIPGSRPVILIPPDLKNQWGADEAPPAEPVEEKTPDDVTEVDVPDLDAVLRLCLHFWQMQPVEIVNQLGYKTIMDALASGIKPWETFSTIKGLNQPKRELL